MTVYITSITQLKQILKKYNKMALVILSDKGVEEMRRLIRTQIYDTYNPRYYGRTGQLGDTPLAIASTGTIKWEYTDSGNWISYKGANQGQHFFPLHGFKSGKVWSTRGYRPQIDMLEITIKSFETLMPNEYLKIMKSFGFNIKRGT